MARALRQAREALRSMKLPSSYRTFLDHATTIAPSVVVALVPASERLLTVVEAQERLRASDLDIGDFIVESPPTQIDAVWQQTIKVRFEDRAEPLFVTFWLDPRPEEMPLTRRPPPDAETEQEAQRERHIGLATSVPMTDSPAKDLQRQFRVLLALAPDAVEVIDAASTAHHSVAWVRDVATASVPPPPMALFAVHAVQPDDKARGAVWLHTHGLLRCGLVELEIVDVQPDDAGSMGELINAVAPMFLDRGLPDPGQEFAVGAALPLVWMPWEEGLKRVRPGWWSESEEREGPHGLPSGILLTPPKGFLLKRHRSASHYAKVLGDNPVVWISAQETERMSALARERFPRFAALHERLGAQEEDFVFLVKLGLDIDGATGPDDREHLWFRVHAIHGVEFEGTLGNQPYFIARLNEGDRGTHSLAPMSDFSILCEHGQFGPDALVILEGILAEGG
jgi:hypothetical protein